MPREITAYSNPLIKRVRSLREKRHRRDEGLFLAEGLRILTEAREAGHIPQFLFYARDSAAHPLVQTLITAVETAGWRGDRDGPRHSLQIVGQGQSASGRRCLR